MKKSTISLVACLATATLLGACSHLQTPPQGVNCTPDQRGAITIKYGVQSNWTIFEVKEKAKVTKNHGLIFKLQPQNYSKPGVPDFRAATVTLVGKKTDDDRNAWFTAISGTYDGTKSDGHKIGICAPDVGDKAETYEYLITVEGLGTLDPRVDVTP